MQRRFEPLFFAPPVELVEPLTSKLLKTIKKAHRNDKIEQEPSGNKNPKKPAHNPTDINKCRLNGHTHFWKNCPNNPNSKHYDGTQYSKVRDREGDGTPAPSKNEDASTNPDAESKRPHKKKSHRDRERREVSSLNSIGSNTSMGSPIISFSEARDSVGSTHSSESESDVESLYSYSTASKCKSYLR